VRVSRKCCHRCGERIRGTVFRFNRKTLCGLCMDDERSR
jgi:formylmethanofuran dehydrogenase subunit E